MIIDNTVQFHRNVPLSSIALRMAELLANSCAIVFSMDFSLLNLDTKCYKNMRRLMTKPTK